MQMHSFVSLDLFPGRESGREGPAFDCEAYAVKERNMWVIGAPEGAGKGIEVAGYRGRGSNFGGDRGRSNSCDDRHRGEIASRGEQRMRRGVI